MAWVEKYRCDRCHSTRLGGESPEGDPPRCFQVSEEFHEFPDGSFVHIRSSVSHGRMSSFGLVEDNPLGDVAEEQADLAIAEAREQKDEAPLVVAGPAMPGPQVPDVEFGEPED